MLKIEDLYEIPGKALDINDWELRPDWFPEIAELEWKLSSDVLEQLVKDNRLTIREIAYQYCDHRRYARMCTLWFDGKPLMIVQNAGREGDDHRKRWITDDSLFGLACAYLRSLLQTDSDNSDVVDPDKLIFEEEAFLFYGYDFAPQLGYQCTKPVPGVHVFGESEVNSIVPEAPKGLLLVTAQADVPLQTYLRRRACVMEKTRALTEEEINRNPRLPAAMQLDKHTQAYWYTRCERPDNAEILVV